MNNTKLRVLAVADVSPLQPSGGSARVVREQTLRLFERGHSVTLLCRHPSGDVRPEESMNGVPVLHYPVSRAHSLSYASTSILGARSMFRERLEGEHWDVVLFHQPFSASGVLPRLPSNIPRLYCFYSPAGVEYRLRAVNPSERRAPFGTGLISAVLRRLERRAIRGCDRIVVLSDFSRRVLLETHGKVAATVVPIPGGVDLEHFHPAPDRLSVRKKLNLPTNSLLLLTVRDLEQRMGIDTLLHALCQLPDDRPFDCLIGGTGPMRRFLEDSAGQLGLGSRVRFLGHIPEDELPLYYQASDLFVLPTREHEGFGLVTVEALACGTPVVATPVGATPEILNSLDSRLLAADAEATSLASSLVRAIPLAAQEDFRRRCRAHAEKSYSWNRHAESLERELLAVQRPTEV